MAHLIATHAALREMGEALRKMEEATRRDVQRTTETHGHCSMAAQKSLGQQANIHLEAGTAVLALTLAAAIFRVSQTSLPTQLPDAARQYFTLHEQKRQQEATHLEEEARRQRQLIDQQIQAQQELERRTQETERQMNEWLRGTIQVQG